MTAQSRRGRLSQLLRTTFLQLSRHRPRQQQQWTTMSNQRLVSENRNKRLTYYNADTCCTCCCLVVALRQLCCFQCDYLLLAFLLQCPFLFQVALVVLVLVVVAMSSRLPPPPPPFTIGTPATTHSLALDLRERLESSSDLKRSEKPKRLPHCIYVIVVRGRGRGGCGYVDVVVSVVVSGWWSS